MEIAIFTDAKMIVYLIVTTCGLLLIAVEIIVTNIGGMKDKETMQLYLHDKAALFTSGTHVDRFPQS